MLGQAIAARPLARDGISGLTSDFGRTRLAEAVLPVRRDEAARADKDAAAAATRP